MPGSSTHNSSLVEALSPDLAFGRHVVTAVLVAHDGMRWLPETLEAVLRQSRPVQRLVTVDNGSRDRTAGQLADAVGEQRVVPLRRDTGFGAAVAQALRHPAAGMEFLPREGAGALSGAVTGQPVEWIWLLHDDSAPAPDALAQLLKVADEDRFAAVLGPKIRDWHDRRRLVEAGVTIDGAGRRETGLEVREVDQGQHDGVHETLAVSTAGMLVRRDVWDALGGLDPDLPLFRDDIDFGWRANSAGYKVVVVTDAVMWHAEASARRRRVIAAAGDHPRRLDRRNAMFVLFANLPFAPLLWVMVRNLFGSLLRTAVFLVGKQPAHALDEVVALTSIAAHPGRLLRARRRRARGRRRHYATIRRLMPPRGHELRRLGDMVGGLLTGAGPVDSGGRHHAALGASLVEEDDALLVEDGVWRRRLAHPAVVMCAALALVSLVAARGLLVGGRLGGGALPPVSGGAAGLWASYAASWHAVGLGSPVSAPPYQALMALLATILLGKVWLAVDVVLFGCVPFAAATAYLASGRVTSYRPVRICVAGAYALLPPVTGAIAAGRIGSAAVVVLVPVFGMLFAGVLSGSRRLAMRSAWGCALLLAVATAFVPMSWVLAAAVCFAAVRWLGCRRGYATIVLVTPMVLLLPWSLRLVRHPSLFAMEAGLHRPDLVEPALDPLAIVLLRPGGPGTGPWWFPAVVVAAGVVALLAVGRHKPVIVGWGVAVMGMTAAVVLTSFEITGLDGRAAPPWPGVPLAVAGAGLLLAAATGGDRLRQAIADRGWRRRAGRAALAAGGAVPAVVGVLWSVGAVPGPLSNDNPEVLPAFVVASSDNGARPRTLVVRREDDGHVAYAVLRGEAAPLGASETPPPTEARQRFDQIVAALASGRGGSEARELAAFGVRYVLLPAPLDGALLRTFNGVPGLERLSVTDSGALWRVTTPAARLRLVAGDGAATPLPAGRVGAWPTVPPGPDGRWLVLAEPADDAWHADVDGTELRPRVAGGWAQAFEVPASGGKLDLGHGRWRNLWLSLQGIATFVVVVLALPGRREDDQDEGIERRERRRGRRTPGRRARGHRVRDTGPQERVPAEVGTSR